MVATHRPSGPAKSLAFRLPYVLFLPLMLAHQEWEVRGLRALARRAGLPLFGPLLERRGLPASDTLFVLGSGSSINSYGSSEWSQIADADSLGLNFWILHDFVPTFLAIEWPRDAARLVPMQRALYARADDYLDVPILIKSLAEPWPEAYPPPVRGNVAFAPYTGLPARTEAELAQTIRVMDRLGMFDPARLRLGLPFYRASLSYAVMLALALGYRRIVLCGVDLNHTRYFYEENAAAYGALGREVPSSGQPSDRHLTMDPSLAVPIDRVLYLLDDLLLKPRGVELYVACRTSALHPRLPAYFA